MSSKYTCFLVLTVVYWIAVTANNEFTHNKGDVSSTVIHRLRSHLLNAGTGNNKLWSHLPNAGTGNDKYVQSINPVRILGNSKRETNYLGTRLKNGADELSQHPVHENQACFKIEAFSKTYILDVTLNNGLFSSNYTEMHYSSTNRTIIKQGAEMCYYHGIVRNVTNSSVAISTCKGIRGVFSDGNHTYVIEPIKIQNSKTDEYSHIVYKATLPTKGTSVAATSIEDNNYIHEDPTQRRDVVSPETKHIGLMLINDNGLYHAYGQNLEITNDFAKTVANIVDELYKTQMNTRIKMVSMETWTSGEMMRVSEDISETLHNLFVYYPRKGTHRNIRHRTVHLLSGRSFDSNRPIKQRYRCLCSDKVTGSAIESVNNPAIVGALLAHGIGHTIGMVHDDGRNCSCPDPYGCIMESTMGLEPPRRFSTCSSADYNDFLGSGNGNCLFGTLKDSSLVTDTRITTSVRKKRTENRAIHPFSNDTTISSITSEVSRMREIKQVEIAELAATRLIRKRYMNSDRLKTYNPWIEKGNDVINRIASPADYKTLTTNRRLLGEQISNNTANNGTSFYEHVANIINIITTKATPKQIVKAKVVTTTEKRRRDDKEFIIDNRIGSNTIIGATFASLFLAGVLFGATSIGFKRARRRRLWMRSHRKRYLGAGQFEIGGRPMFRSLHRHKRGKTRHSKTVLDNTCNAISGPDTSVEETRVMQTYTSHSVSKNIRSDVSTSNKTLCETPV